MAFHTKLPIYKVAYDLLAHATTATASFPRSVRRLGDRIRDLCIDTVLLVARANASIDKVPHLATLLERNAELEILLRLSVDKHFIARSHYARAIELTQSVGRQANAWKGKYANSPAV
jgi:hypothetical protein